MNYTDEQLKKTLAKMLPEKIKWETEGWQRENLVWEATYEPEGHWRNGQEVLDTELLHLCHLVEETLNEIESADYAELLRPIAASYKLLYHASWLQRVVALTKVKGIEI